MRTKRFDFNFKPLQINISMVVDGSVPDSQNYDADTDTFTPDYTISSLIVQPTVSRLDKDEILAAGRINHELANVTWAEIVNGKEVLIEDTNANYKIIRSGGQAGRIEVKKNARPQIPINLLFRATYQDSRNGQVHNLVKPYQVQCKNSTTYIPYVEVDAADQTLYDPFMDPDKQTVNAYLRIGKDIANSAKVKFVWEKYRGSANWSAIGSDNMDYDVAVSENGANCVVDRSLMGNELYIRCRAKYSENGDPNAVVLSSTSPEKIFSFVRRLPKYEYDFAVPTNIEAGLLKISPQMLVWNTKGSITNPEKELLPLWMVATNKQSGSLSYSLIGHGQNPNLPTKAMDARIGAVYGLDLKDVGPTAAWADSDGSVFVDGDGNIILIK